MVLEWIVLPTWSAVSFYAFYPLSRLFGVGHRVLIVGIDCRLYYLSVVVVCYWLSVVCCLVLTIDCRVSLSMIDCCLFLVPGCRLLDVGR